MTKTLLQEMTYAGNPHDAPTPGFGVASRFGERAVASAKPRRGARLHKWLMVAVGCLALAWTAGAAVEVSDLSVSPRTDESGLADISFKVTSDVGGTNLVFEVAAYSKERDVYFTDGDISLNFGVSFTQDVLMWFMTAGAMQDVHLVWNWKRHNPDLDWNDVTVEVTAKLQGEDVAVKCQNGTFIGVRDSVSGVVAFKSVPYAQPPTKETGLRWKPPVKPNDSDSVFLARHFDPAAAQTRSDGEVASYGPLSEDCLKLSIWTAGGFTTGSNRSVMFFIHGGSYGWGGMSDPLYDGERLVRDNPDIILVSCDYRLNAFGFLDLTGLPGYDPEKHKDYNQAGNLGILDLQAGLKWVKANIAQFGGDPENITIFGESAGGGSVSCLLQAKGSEGLFKRAIVMSGALDLTDSPENYEAGNQAYLLMKAANKSGIDELLNCTTEELIDALYTPLTDPRLATVRHRTPREGGDLVADLNNYPMCDDVRGIVVSDPYEACRTNTVAKNVDVMIGTTSEEMNYWAVLMYGVSREGTPSTTDPLGYFYQYLSNKVDSVRALYARFDKASVITDFLAGPGASHPFDRDERYNLGGMYPYIWGCTELLSELAFRMPAIVMAERRVAQVEAASGTGKTYMYYFCRPWKSEKMPWMGACHASELTSVFKNLHLDVDGGEDAKKTLAENVSGAFVAFAKTGDPGEQWAEYETTERTTTVIGTKGDFVDAELRLVSDPDGAQRELLEPDFPAYRKEKLRAGIEEIPWVVTVGTHSHLAAAWTSDDGAVTNAVVGGGFGVTNGTTNVRVIFTAESGWEIVGDAVVELGTVTENVVFGEESGYSVPGVQYAPVPYIDADGVKRTKAAGEFDIVTAEMRTLESGWYAVIDDIDITAMTNIVVQGDVHLILCDGASLTVTNAATRYAALSVGTNATLTIYAQANGTGRLTAKGGGSAPAIGGSQIGGGCGAVVIHGGTITANGGVNAAGIGGCYKNNGGSVTITGGRIAAAAKSAVSADIGNGNLSVSPCEVSISGGVFAREPQGDWCAEGCSVVANPDPATAEDYPFAVRPACRVTIGEHPHVAAAWTSDDGAVTNAVVGGGFGVTNGTTNVRVIFTVESGWEIVGDAVVELGTVTENVVFGEESGYSVPTVRHAPVPYIDADGVTRTKAAGEFDIVTAEMRTLENGWYAVVEDVDITAKTNIVVQGDVHLILCDGATLAITNRTSDAAVSVGAGAVLAIYGQAANTGRLEAMNGNSGAGIGGGNGGECGAIAIHGGTVNAAGGTYSAGIGSGMLGSGGMVTITGGRIAATGHNGAADIGDGRSAATPCAVSISGGIFAREPLAGWLVDEYAVITNQDAATVAEYPWAVVPYPETWPAADDAVKAKFGPWRNGAGLDADLATAAAQKAFLLNVDLDGIKDLRIESIAVDTNDCATIVVGAPGAFFFDRLDLGAINGILYVHAGDTLETMEPKAVPYRTMTNGKANIAIKARFIRAAIGFQAPEE